MSESLKKNLTLTFCGGTGSVTGANFLLESDQTKIVIDCGMEQGTTVADEFNHRPFAFDPHAVDVLLITHAHIDHVGRIPKLVRDGFKGVVYSTPETRELTVLMLEDALKITTQDAARRNIKPLYDSDDVRNSFKNWKTIPYHVKTRIAPDFEVYLKDAGHVLGSAMYEVLYNGKKIVFTGDLGNSPTPLLKDTEEITDADYLIMESVYGDRNHERKEDRRRKLEDVIEDVILKKGVLMIPSFSLEKTQVILYEINELIEEGRVQSIPVYIDSPLAIKITEIYKRYPVDFNPRTRELIRKGDDIFDFPKLHFTETSEESKAIFHTPNPKIIIAGSGMSNGGRIMHHELNYISNPANTLLLAGYQAVNTIGRQIGDGAKSVSIYGQHIPIHARIEHIDGYSSHKDSDNLFAFVENTADTVKGVFVAMGEPKSAMFMVQRLRDNLGLNAYAPKEGDKVNLEC
jgi:metallo-beta-lactamase family protein